MAIGKDQLKAALPAAIRTSKISSVAYATDERASEERTANASALLSRSSAWALVGNDLPIKTRLRLENDIEIAPVLFYLKKLPRKPIAPTVWEERSK